MLRRFTLARVAIISLFAFPLLLLAGTTISYLAAQSNGDQVTVKWTSGVEQNVSYYEVERAASGSQQYTDLAAVSPKGSYANYSYTDESGLQKQLATQGVYTYRLKIYSSDGSFTYSQTATVEFNASSVRRTWGQIKEMFR